MTNSVPSNSSELASLTGYFFAFVSALMGVLMGWVIAQCQWKAKVAKERETLKQNIIKAFHVALGGIDKCLEMLTATPVVTPNFKLDSPTLAHLLYSGRDLFHDEATFDAFNWQRYQLDHINAKLDYVHIYLALISSNSVDKSLVSHEYSSLLAHLKITKKEISELLAAHERKPWLFHE